MSRKAAFHRAVCGLVRTPGGREVLELLVNEGKRIVEAYEAGDVERGRELLGDVEARFLLRQALPSWGWRDGAGDGL